MQTSAARQQVLGHFSANRVPTLSREEERDLLVRARGGDIRARKRLWHAMMGYVLQWALKQRLGSVLLEDVIQEASIGLSSAIDHFDLSHRVRFATYAKWWVMAHGGRYLKQARSVVRPRSGWSAQEDASLNVPLDVEDEGSEAQLANLADEAPTPEENAAASDLDATVRRSIWRLQRKLTPVAREVIEFRLMRPSQDQVTLDAIGQRYGLSRERVRQVEIMTRQLLGRVLAREVPDYAGKSVPSRRRGSRRAARKETGT